MDLCVGDIVKFHDSYSVSDVDVLKFLFRFVYVVPWSSTNHTYGVGIFSVVASSRRKCAKIKPHLRVLDVLRQRTGVLRKEGILMLTGGGNFVFRKSSVVLYTFTFVRSSNGT